MTRGVIYIATGRAHVAAACASAASVRRSNPGLGLALFSDAAPADPVFDEVRPILSPHARSKVDHLAATPFRETLFLDSDTRVVGDLGDLYRLLERFDIAAAQRSPDPGRLRRAQAADAPPAAFPEYNGGVLLYRVGPRVLAFLKAWQACYHARGGGADQVSLRTALWESDLAIATLPQRFNRRNYTWIDHWFERGLKPVVLHTNRFHPTKYGPPWLRRLRGALEGPGR